MGVLVVMDTKTLPLIQFLETCEVSIQSNERNRFESDLGSTLANLSPVEIFSDREIASWLSLVGAPEISILLTESSEDQPSK